MENDEKFQTYANELIRNVPMEVVNYLVSMFMREASINMGTDVNKDMTERTIYYIKKDFSYLPVNFVASAFVRGSLGSYGPGRLVPRTILGWLNDSAQEYNRFITKEKNEEIEAGYIHADLHKYPLGQAICKKMDWLVSGRISGDDWDKIPLKELSERINQGLESYPEVFGIKSVE